MTCFLIPRPGARRLSLPACAILALVACLAAPIAIPAPAEAQTRPGGHTPSFLRQPGLERQGGFDARSHARDNALGNVERRQQSFQTAPRPVERAPQAGFESGPGAADFRRPGARELEDSLGLNGPRSGGQSGAETGARPPSPAPAAPGAGDGGASFLQPRRDPAPLN